MEESVDLHKKAGTKNKQTLVNLSPAKKAMSKDDVEIHSSTMASSWAGKQIK